MADERDVAAEFSLAGPVVAIATLGGGHINDTFLVESRGMAGPERVVLQRINAAVFTDPDAVMANVERVCAHAQARLVAEGLPDADRRSLRLVPTRSGRGWHVDAQGGRWRCYHFISGAAARAVAASPRQAFEAAAAFGRFQTLLADLPGGRLTETIPRFHDTPRRFADFRAVLARDPHGRAAAAGREIDFALAREAGAGLVVDAIASGEIPERVSHNDAKLANVLLDDATGEGLCVIDLDTVMPGSPLYDFGDLARTCAATAPEDEPDVDRLGLRPDMFAALAAGFGGATAGVLTARERELLPAAARLITLEQGVRFLGDWLAGDVYYRVSRPAHNLVRARAQFRLVAAWEAELPRLAKCIH
jgi:aminoglycoside phosphotransferase (APT) family kinase protein